MTQFAEKCGICNQNRVMTKHHVWRRAVWGRTNKNNTIIYICRYCHEALEIKITERENEILRQHPEIYSGTLNEFISRATVINRRKRR